MAAFPTPRRSPMPASAARREAALDYMGLAPGAPIAGTPVDWVFIGSCTNSRISDLRAAAEVARRGKVAAGVRAWVVPGSEGVKRQAEAEGLDQHLQDRRLRMARAGLLDVPCRQRRDGAARAALGLDLEPQLRRPPGTGRPHPSREPGHGGGGGACRRHRRCADGSAAEPMEKFTLLRAVAAPLHAREHRHRHHHPHRAAGGRHQQERSSGATLSSPGAIAPTAARTRISS